mgnify:CR=1 FL=1
MPNDEKKQYHVVEYVMGSNERQHYEDALNELHAAGYHVYDVNYEKGWVTGCLSEADDDEDQQTDALKEIAEMRDQMMQQAGLVPGAPAAPPQEDDATRELREYRHQGIMTNHLLYGIRSVHMAAAAGDTQTETRLDYLVTQIFGQTSTEELTRSLNDVAFFRQHYEKHQCEKHDCGDPSCAGTVSPAVLFEKVEAKIKKRLGLVLC